MQNLRVDRKTTARRNLFVCCFKLERQDSLMYYQSTLLVKIITLRVILFFTLKPYTRRLYASRCIPYRQIKVLLIFFLVLSSVLWMTTFGYLISLSLVRVFQKKNPAKNETLPKIAVVVPTLNEEGLISGKLRNLETSDYPDESMQIFVIDGGSTDKTIDTVKQEINGKKNTELICLAESKAKPDQINYVLQNLDYEIIVFTDADGRLEPSCLKELVTCLISDSSVSVMGAFIHPETPFLEERLYWSFINQLWWLEGEVFSSACVSAVCHACRRKHVLPLASDALADDINIALSAAAKGLRVRTCPNARASEIRVPFTKNEFMKFRQLRGKNYLVELKRSSKLKKAPLRWRLTLLLKLWHLKVTPKAIPLFVFSAISLLFSRYHFYPIFMIVIFMLPISFSLLKWNKDDFIKKKWRVLWAAVRLPFLTIMPMLTLNKTKRSRFYMRG